MKLISEFLKVIHDRGFVHQVTDLENLDKLLLKKNGTAYIGFDCTAPSLHVGSLIQIMMLRWFQKTGNIPIVLVGGGTTKIGDPSGKDSARPILSTKIINKNKLSIKKVFKNYLNFSNKVNGALMIDNEDWLDKINYISFLREFGSFFSINKMLSLESIKARLDREQNLSFLEFNYPILQAYDFLKLNEKFNCSLQMGGSDQWGNIVNGVELIRKKTFNQVFGLTSPLLTTSSGSKMGKSEKGAIWLDNTMLSDYDFWQFWRNTEDEDVIKFLKLFTEIELSKIQELKKLKGAKINEAKILLANEVTKMCRGNDAAIKSSETAFDTFSNSKLNENLPILKIKNDSIAIIDTLKLLNFCKSNGEARRLIRGNGIKLNDKLVIDENFFLLKKEMKNKKIKISVGKKRHALISFT